MDSDFSLAAKQTLENYDANVPKEHDRVYKDECLYSFDSPDFEGGLFICLKTFAGFGYDHVERHHRKTGCSVFLHMLRHKIEVGDAPTERKVTRLAIGVDGGFDPDAENKKYKTIEEYSIVILPSFKSFPFETSELPQKVIDSIKGIIEAKSANYLDELQSMSSTWDGEVRQKTRYADIEQLNNGKTIAPSGWKCDFENCDKVDNLWLNLTDGSIYCGRKFFDGSGGNGHATLHYEKTKYPLAVKLGTITKDGKGDVYSYPEDDMVENPNLIKHLSHFGINISALEKTEKSMIELELALNQKVGEWATLQESGSELKPIFGPGYTGIHNLGNSCYMNSIIQVLFSISDFTDKYYLGSKDIFEMCQTNPTENFDVQMAKVAHGLCSGKYSTPPPDVVEGKKYWHHGIRPTTFKSLIGKGHSEFASKKQQDAQEFFLYFLSLIERYCQLSQNPAECFKFNIEERYQCSTTGQIDYTYRPEYCLPLSISLDNIVNKAEVEAFKQKQAENDNKDLSEVVRPKLTFASCLHSFGQPEIIEQFFNPSLNQRTTAEKITRFASFPDYLMIHLKKFTLRHDWTPIKLDVSVEMPEDIDIEYLRGNGAQEGENLMIETIDTPPVFVYDEKIMSELTNMGFPPEACKRAIFFTKNNSLNDATNWLMEHISDSDFSDPFQEPGTAINSEFLPNEEAAAMIMSMGFERNHVIAALKATENNLDRALDWIMSHGPEEILPTENTPKSQIFQFRDGKGIYKLFAFISHMGSSSTVGHYVCHIKKEGRWVIFNDEKVAVSQNPPTDLGYLYVYKRMANDQVM
ncbi:ubiquitin carboxyl-terminal hydrolase 5-like isoform X2 [Myzus persicae]|uniref:ubiquitin carboxyl-terminal hydrolase 5-like isoform X2 n=1 Tax=Myzus persicae TaxID=13164 RepID=UPI000B9356A0|nr:ubiquitin carboxyl-terminal hydrolase 5-like isoform X2 [Myzus persicae]